MNKIDLLACFINNEGCLLWLAGSIVKCLRRSPYISNYACISVLVSLKPNCACISLLVSMKLMIRAIEGKAGTSDVAIDDVIITQIVDVNSTALAPSRSPTGFPQDGSLPKGANSTWTGSKNFGLIC